LAETQQLDTFGRRNQFLKQLEKTAESGIISIS